MHKVSRLRILENSAQRDSFKFGAFEKHRLLGYIALLRITINTA